MGQIVLVTLTRDDGKSKMEMEIAVSSHVK